MYSLGSEEFMMAFAVENFDSQIIAYDSRYIRWVIRTWDTRETQKTKTILYYPLHVCSDEEVRQFFPAENDSTANNFNAQLAAKSLFCLHPSVRDFNLTGSFLTSADSTTYDVWLTTCASRYELFDGSVLEVDEDCVEDLQEVKKYFKGDAFYMSVFYNQQTFKQDVYGAERIEKRS